MELLRNAVRPYAWGSRHTIAALLGRPVPAPHPEAELWLGAHPADPSVLLRADGGEPTLTDILRADPIGSLGTECVRRWGDRLPFLLKVLAAEEPLSLQAHPSLEQAVEGFAREEASGIPIDANNRNYKDPNHKPELICALTEFHALAGFRETHRTVEFFEALAVPELVGHVRLLGGQPDAEGLRALFTTWITLPQPAIEKLLPSLLDACVRHIREHGPFALECRTALELAEAYPGDAGVLAALLLNRLVLAPGEAMYLPAGNMHAYLHGCGIEIMANSDNVLRGGLTPKHVDVPELMRVLDFSFGDMPIMRGQRVGEYLTEYRTPAPDFALSRVDFPETGEGRLTFRSDGPQILLCTAGAVEVNGPDGPPIAVKQGGSLWIPAEDPPVTLRSIPGDGPSQLFRAAAGLI